MSAKIDLLISGLNTDYQNSIEFFADMQWDQLTEINISKTLREILSFSRPFSKSLHIEVIIRSDDPERLKLLIKRNILKQSQQHPQKLSAREIEIFNLIVQGYTNKEIASKLFVCFETVRSHRKNILHKTGCANTPALINYFHNAFFDNKLDAP